ncbi:MAG: argininosuccinate lyase [Candidatus Paceibacterota bacterium]
MATLWNKNNKKKTHPVVERYTAGTDHIFDVFLFPFDIEATLVHAKGLKKIGILTAAELGKIEKALSALSRDVVGKRIRIRPEDEDCHTVIENYLVAKLGDTGKKVHTGRSRNDQVLVAMRLYMKHALGSVRAQCLDLAELFITKAERYARVPMPGYSHTQQAMLTSVGHYFASFAESLLDDEALLASIARHIDKNPLGSAAGFGTAIPLDRAYTTRELGFADVQINSLYCQSSRGKFESAFLEGLSQVSATLARFANDMILFTSQEFSFFSADESVVTGSSIMPHKKNLDPLELARGSASILIGNHVAVKELSRNLLSGYNRDLQLMKKPLMESVRSVSETLSVIAIVLQRLVPNEKEILAKIHPGMFTADIANDMVMTEGVPFRDAYRMAAEMTGDTVDFAKNLSSKKSIGAPGNLSLAAYKRRLKTQRSSIR